MVDLISQPFDEVRFGATFTIKEGSMDKLLKYQNVGVDEAILKLDR